MNTATDPDTWRRKYFDSLSSLENEQRQFRAMETTLRRLTSRLCTASLGRSSRLDDQIKKLQGAMRREAGSEELDQLVLSLTEAIHALDQVDAASWSGVTGPHTAAPPSKSTSSGATGPIRDDERVRAILAALLAELRRDPALVDEADALDASLTTAMTPDRLPDLLSSLASLVGRRIKHIETAKQEVEALLGHMVGRLDEIGRFVTEQHQSQTQSQASTETLNTQLTGEMRAMGESVESASDLQQIRMQVRHRLESIDRHLQEFREREARLAGEMQARSEQMRSRIVELETEASRLQRQLKDEQHLATVDPLTGIPNRLAYDRRIEDEIKRWHRFRQPTCVAVWDIDRFKVINDSYGHRAGDRVLATVAECLAARIRGADFIARYGGEEFVMILPGTVLEDAAHFIEEIRTAASHIGFHFRGTPVSITLSTGVTALTAGDSAESAFDRADKALYRAKENGRNRCVTI